MSIRRLAREFDLVIVLNDLWLAAICRLLLPRNVQTAFLGFYYDASSPATGLRHAKYKMLASRIDRIVVHTSAEVGLYAESLGIPRARFEFIPYYAYSDAMGTAKRQNTAPAKPVILAPGRHRDLPCFCKAIEGLNARAIVVCGLTDLPELEGAAARSNVEIHSEVPRERYRELMADADIVVIPLYADRWQRSLGQIALFDAVLMGKPVVVARTFQLADYVSESEVLFYEPGNAADLRSQLEKLMGDAKLRESLTARAFRRITTEFTEERFAADMAAACRRWCGY